MAIDLEPAARRLADLVASVPDDRLDAPTPCPDYRLGALLDHVGSAALAFAAAARKDTEASSRRAPGSSQLGDDWRHRIPRDVIALAEAWREPSAWSGMTRIAGLDLPGEVTGLFALDELVIHAWDVARASGQPYDPDPASVQVLLEFVGQFCGPGMQQQRSGLFGPEVPVPEDAPLFHQVLGMTGRDPGWQGG